MPSSLLKNYSPSLLGAAFILLGAMAAPAKAADLKLTGFSTTGEMMTGLEVTVSFIDGTSETAIWNVTGDDSGGASGTGWSITQSDDSYNSPWIFTSTGQEILSLVLYGIPGNTAFDTLPYLKGPQQTDGSAEGRAYQPTSGQSADSYAYTDPVAGSNGDLFGTLTLYWSSGFTGSLVFLADTDSGSRDTPIQPQNPEVRESPPTVDFSPPTIYESQCASTTVYATDPNEDAIAFFLNGSNLGTDFNRSGTRYANADLGCFYDNGVVYYTVQARDEDGNYSEPVTKPLTVLNIPPTVTSLSIPTIYEGQSALAYITADDPGADAASFILNGVNMGTDPNTSGTRSLTANLGYFADDAYIPYTAYAVDDDGDYSAPAYSALTVLNVAPTVTSLTIPTIYEGQSALAYITADDPGADAVSFILNGVNMGTDPNTSGIRSLTANLGYFTDDAYIPYTGYAVDDDSGSSTPAYSALTVLNVAPTLTAFDLSQQIIFEGQSATAYMYSTDPGTDTARYSINAEKVDFDSETSGTRSGTEDLGTFVDEGKHVYRARARDDDSGKSTLALQQLVVLNVAPTITEMTQDLTVTSDEVFEFVAAATDPGVEDILTYAWDLDGDGLYDDSIGSTGESAFEEEGVYQVALQVSDGDGGYDYSSFTVTVIDEDSPSPPVTPDSPTTVPEPGSTLGILSLGALGVGAVLKRKQRR